MIQQSLSSLPLIPYLLLERKAILELPGNLDQSSRLWVIFRFIHLTNGFLKPKQRFLELCMRLWIIIDWSVTAKIFKQQWILTDALDRLGMEC